MSNPNFTARSPEELAIVTAEAKAQSKKHLKYYMTQCGWPFNGVGVSATNDSVDAFLDVRVVQNTTGGKFYCMIWLTDEDRNVLFQSENVGPSVRDATCDAFNQLLDGHNYLHWSYDAYVSAIAELYRPAESFKTTAPTAIRSRLTLFGESLWPYHFLFSATPPSIH